MSYTDEDLLPISALQHLAFCERQCALIHVEREWEENERTADGRVLHERVDEGYRAYRRGLKQFAGVHVRSLRLGIAGRLDVVELVRTGDAPDTCRFLGVEGAWDAHPVEFKRGRPKQHDADRVQICAQALCLEEMTGQPIAAGSLFYGQLRRRDEILFTSDLRERTLQLVARLREVLSLGLLPAPVYKRHCHACSLMEVCQPRQTSGALTALYRKELLG
jgi:CRISPR-associated exonuclease Cas4